MPAGGTSSAVWDADRARWLPLKVALDQGAAAARELERRPAADGPHANHPLDDLIALLADGEETRALLSALIDECADFDIESTYTLAPLLPFQPVLLRAYANFERHWVQAARGLVRLNLPRALPAIRAVEALTRKPFKPFHPGRLFYEQPSFYLGNPLTIVADGEEAPWPPYSDRLDFELELGAIVVRPLENATPDEGRDAIGGFVVFNDLSARDTQWRELRDGLFGPVVKTKTFASSMSAEVVSADEVWPRLRRLEGEVRVNGETWARTSTREMQWDFGEMAAFASEGEPLRPGELLSSGTLPDGCGLELDRWIKPGDRLELRIDGIGSVTNVIGPKQGG